jgi:hypothetical protein
MTKQVTIWPKELADRPAARELVEPYAHCVYRRAEVGTPSWPLVAPTPRPTRALTGSATRCNLTLLLRKLS